jgi:hypothetical protein
MGNGAAVEAFTVTIPDAAHSACLLIEGVGWLGAGGAIEEHEGASHVSARLIITRTPGVAAVATLTTIHAASLATVAGGISATISVTVGAVAGGVDEVNTFALNLVVTRGSGTSANHAAVGWVELVAEETSGITVAAA